MIYSPFSRPLYVMLKPTGSLCNLHCDYCYYLEKQHLYNGTKSSQQVMSDALLEKFTREYIEAQTEPDVLFTWHGGEPLMRPISFYRKALKLQKIYGRGRHIENNIQTNGTLINEEWCDFFRRHHFLVGISIDGPEEFNHFRHYRGGKEAFSKIVHGIELLNRYGVEWNAMATINSLNVLHPKEFYHFFKDMGCQFLQFSPIVERELSHDDGRKLATPHEQGAMLPQSVNPEDYGRFLCGVFDEWVREDVGKIFVQLFDSTLACWMGIQPGVCTMAKACGHAGVMEYNGDVYSCDHYVFPEYKIGNIYEKTLIEMMYSDRQLQFGQQKRSLPQQCVDCQWLFACNGGCPKDRFVKVSEIEDGPMLNYLCPAFKMFFNHVAPAMDFMRNELLNKRPPANIMKYNGFISKE
ncbi:MAG: anaerobic sulfatase-maturation protein [Prevotella sp.]|jgi:uncharacterized protein